MHRDYLQNSNVDTMDDCHVWSTEDDQLSLLDAVAGVVFHTHTCHSILTYTQHKLVHPDSLLHPD